MEWSSKGINNNFSLNCYDIRNHAINKHGQIDAKPYGGGEGMLMMPEPSKKDYFRYTKKDKGHVSLLITSRKTVKSRQS